MTGNFVVFSSMSTTLVRHQAQGLGVALILILGVMAIQFRSIRLGLLCAIPNGAPVLAVYGLMGWSGVALSVPTAMIASVAIGTIVDNSIYLLARFREAFAQQPDYVEALIAMVLRFGTGGGVLDRDACGGILRWRVQLVRADRPVRCF